VSKEEHSDWKDYEDKIQHVVDLGFSVIFENNSASKATGDLYVSKDGTLTSAQDVIDNAVKVLSGIVVDPNSDKRISWQGSYEFLGNFDTLKKFVMDGEFYLYAVGIGDNLNLDLRKIAIILTVNTEP